MAATETPSTRVIGSPIKRVEDPRLITGSARYIDDLKLPGMAYVAILRSPYAHARITSISTDRARALPGVVGRLHRQGLRAPQPAALRLAGRRRREPRRDAARARDRPRHHDRRRGGRGRGRERRYRRGRAGADRRPLGAARRRRRLRGGGRRGRAPDPPGRAQQHRHGLELRRRRGHRQGPGRGRRGRAPAHRQPAPDSDAAGGARRGRHPRSGHRPVHRLDDARSAHTSCGC